MVKWHTLGKRFSRWTVWRTVLLKEFRLGWIINQDVCITYYCGTNHQKTEWSKTTAICLPMILQLGQNTDSTALTAWLIWSLSGSQASVTDWKTEWDGKTEALPQASGASSISESPQILTIKVSYNRIFSSCLSSLVSLRWTPSAGLLPSPLNSQRALRTVPHQPH